MNPVPVAFRLATWNLRYDVRPDTIPVAKSLAALPDLSVAPPPLPRGERPWSARRIRVAQRLGASHVDLVGAFPNQKLWGILHWMTLITCCTYRISGGARQAGP